MPMTRALLAVAVLFAFLLPPSARADDLLIIANPSVGLTAPLTLNQIAAIYLLQTTNWPDGSHIVPVNREATSDIRARFTASVLKQDNASIAAYWNEMHFLGKQPPVVQESEKAMLAFIQRVPGAVGYINASTQPIDVKVLAHVP
jgi:ABC-type phosphate transport system substrate-binding protein